MPPPDARRPNPFEILGIPYEADDSAVRKAYVTKTREARAAGDDDLEYSILSAWGQLRSSGKRKQLAERFKREAMVAQLLQAAQQAIDAGDFEGARRALDRALGIVPDGPPAIALLVEVALAGGDLDAAIQHLERLERLQPLSSRWPYELAMALTRKSETFPADVSVRRPWLGKARDAVGRARALGAGALECALADAMVLIKLGRKDEARQILERAAVDVLVLGERELKVILALITLQAEDSSEVPLAWTLARLEARLPGEPERRLWLARGLEDIALSLVLQGREIAQGWVDLVASCLPGEVQPVLTALGAPSPRQQFLARVEQARRT